ncbi:hypothetical protein VKT23_014337 [Stygiomarasmius scandens]|uniref:NAD(P)-binding protein n=1 Tax=Marasmiellus scandens TaxID=2682957 RepID=A0ABR1J0S7_9AGAR
MVLVLVALSFILLSLEFSSRQKGRILQTKERAVILRSSSGIGRVIATKYAKRGAYVCVVGRRETKVSEVVEECKALAPGPEATLNMRIAGFVGDIAEVDATIRLRGTCFKRSLRESQPSDHFLTLLSPSQSTALLGNVASGDVGTDVVATTFIPLLSKTSARPSIHLISSLASVIPAPPRSLYGSTKGASLILYHSLSIEHFNINWSYVLPSTVQGSFHAGAVDMFSHSENETNSACAISITPGLSPASGRYVDTGY